MAAPRGAVSRAPDLGTALPAVFATADADKDAVLASGAPPAGHTGRHRPARRWVTPPRRAGYDHPSGGAAPPLLLRPPPPPPPSPPVVARPPPLPKSLSRLPASGTGWWHDCRLGRLNVLVTSGAARQRCSAEPSRDVSSLLSFCFSSVAASSHGPHPTPTPLDTPPPPLPPPPSLWPTQVLRAGAKKTRPAAAARRLGWWPPRRHRATAAWWGRRPQR